VFCSALLRLLCAVAGVNEPVTGARPGLALCWHAAALVHYSMVWEGSPPTMPLRNSTIMTELMMENQ
jgi:hypothetical protein